MYLGEFSTNFGSKKLLLHLVLSVSHFNAVKINFQSISILSLIFSLTLTLGFNLELCSIKSILCNAQADGAWVAIVKLG